MATRRRKKKFAEPECLASVLLSVSRLPEDDTIRIAALWRLRILLSLADASTIKLAELLGTTVRGAQRIRQAYGLAALRGLPQER